MSNLKSGIALSEGEKVVMEIEAELWATSSNPIAQALGWVIKFIYLILGVKKKGVIVITDKRVIEVRQDIVCWRLNADKNVKYVLPSSLKEVGYTKTSTFCGCFCQAYHLYYESFTQSTMVLLKGADEAEAQKTVDAFYNAICAANK